MSTQAAERQSTITMRGNAVTLAGNELKVGDKAPDFNVVKADMSPFHLADATENGKKAALFIAVPSLDTGVCSLESQTFNKRWDELPGNVNAFVVSMDLPFAQDRWSKEQGDVKLTMLSDYREHSFGTAYGILMKPLSLLARVVFLVDKAGTIAYIQAVPEVTTEPNYDEVFAAAKKLG